jgi:glycosyltransferase involved in cell wall biosynthesis
VAERRKGLDQLPAFMNRLMEDRRGKHGILLTFGGTSIPWSGGEGWQAQHVAQFRDDQVLVDLYSSGDLVVVPSREDNSPLVAQEALACGRPLVAGRVGGLPELVLEGTTGALAESPEAESLALAAERVLRHRGTEYWENGCRAFAEMHFDPAVQAGKYRDLYQDLIGERNA